MQGLCLLNACASFLEKREQKYVAVFCQFRFGGVRREVCRCRRAGIDSPKGRKFNVMQPSSCDVAVKSAAIAVNNVVFAVKVVCLVHTMLVEGCLFRQACLVTDNSDSS